MSCPNDVSRGGLYLYDFSDNSFERVFETECMGVYPFKRGYIVGSRSIYWKEELGPQIPHSLIYLDQDFRVRHEFPLSGFGIGDIHDVVYREGRLWVVDTWANRIVGFTTNDEIDALSTTSSIASLTAPELQWVDPVAKESDASHVNGLCFLGSRMLVSVFGRYATHRGYEARNQASGCLLEITGHLQPFGTNWPCAQPIVICQGLADPHSLVSYKGSFYFIESGAGRIIKDWHTVARIDEGYARGLLVQDNLVLVGISNSRHRTSSKKISECAKILVLDSTSWTVMKSVKIPASEVYTFLALPDGLPSIDENTSSSKA